MTMRLRFRISHLLPRISRSRMLAAWIVLSICAWSSVVFADDKKAAKDETAWAFRKPVRSALPAVHNKSWLRNPIDAFVLSKLEAAGLQPSPEASRAVLIRRVSFDLLGIPPTPAEVKAFVQDDRPDAYEKLVDKLLNSPRFGEHWATYWLDLVRYAETDGFKADDKRPNAWRYRDYTVDAVNRDKSYARFLQEQLAGDELFPHEPDAAIATGFLRHYPDEYNAVALDLRRQEILNDITDVCSSALLGLTMGCARCHDHKFDPILQTDYYRLQAFFAAYQPADLPLANEGQDKRHAQAQHEWEEKTKAIRQEMATLEKDNRTKAGSKRMARFPKEYQEAYLTPPERRTPLETQLAYMVEKQVLVPRDEVLKVMSSEVRTRWETLNKEMKKFENLKPSPYPAAMGMTEIGATAPPTYLLKRGEWKARGVEVPPGFPSAIDDREAPLPDQLLDAKTTGRRSVLATWLTSPDNPLTARVAINRLWQHHFGRGIVGTPSDFGVQGDPPTHPELLDWLAVEFMENGWSPKAMHRLVVTSAAYRQASVDSQEGSRVDPQNLLLWRARRKRLEGESLRDAMLAVSARLDDRMSGPSIHPPLPAETPGAKTWPVDADPTARDRRSVYVYVKRNLRYPLFDLFDVPDSNETCARRHVTTNAPQALALLNSQMTRDMARSLARRVLQEAGRNANTAVERAMFLALGRAPDGQERQTLAEFVKRASTATDLDKAVEDVCHALLNLNEFLYVD
jgi:Protein of unknown function (DUF1553)/Protein of unknown function (DUF1549)